MMHPPVFAMKGWTICLMLVFAAALSLIAVGSADGAVWIVDDDNGTWADFGTIQEAVDAASAGDTIYVYNGT